ncbi:hypothetical protein [Bacillus sp. SD088]|nr:hypothetical protein [Bacillus sp. SD088]
MVPIFTMACRRMEEDGSTGNSSIIGPMLLQVKKEFVQWGGQIGRKDDV